MVLVQHATNLGVILIGIFRFVLYNIVCHILSLDRRVRPCQTDGCGCHVWHPDCGWWFWQRYTQNKNISKLLHSYFTSESLFHLEKPDKPIQKALQSINVRIYLFVSENFPALSQKIWQLINSFNVVTVYLHWTFTVVLISFMQYVLSNRNPVIIWRQIFNTLSPSIQFNENAHILNKPFIKEYITKAKNSFVQLTSLKASAIQRQHKWCSSPLPASPHKLVLAVPKTQEGFAVLK